MNADEEKQIARLPIIITPEDEARYDKSLGIVMLVLAVGAIVASVIYGSLLFVAIGGVCTTFAAVEFIKYFRYRREQTAKGD